MTILKALSLTALLALTACGGDRGLRDLRSAGDGPDEFSVSPVRPLEIPADDSLPEPTPGGSNLSDPSPNADAIAALGGNPAAAVRGGIPSADAALVAGAGRFGVESGIRATLAEEDRRFRARAGRFSLFARSDRYFRAYARQALDAHAELQRLRAAGVQTPSAPPE